MVNVNLPTINFIFLQHVILSLFMESANCRYCSNIVDWKLSVRDHIFFRLYSPDYRKDCLIPDIIVPLKDNPEGVTLQNKKFILRVVVDFVRP